MFEGRYNGHFGHLRVISTVNPYSTLIEPFIGALISPVCKQTALIKSRDPQAHQPLTTDTIRSVQCHCLVLSQRAKKHPKQSNTPLMIDNEVARFIKEGTIIARQ